MLISQAFYAFLKGYYFWPPACIVLKLPSNEKQKGKIMNITNRYIRERQERAHSYELAQKLLKTPAKTELLSTPSESVPLVSPELKKMEQILPKTFQPLMGGKAVRNLEYKGLLSNNELDRIQKNYPAYKEAEQKADVNWRVLAAIHYRETNLSQHPLTKGNPFQFDGVYKSKVTGDLFKDAVTAGKILQAKTQIQSARYGLEKVAPLQASQTEGENLRQAVFRYNGPIYGSPEKSPYVMNGLDEKHQGMLIYRGRDVNPRWGVDHRPGIMALVKDLEVAFPEVK